MLSACNVVVTKDPLFTPADEAGAPAAAAGPLASSTAARLQGRREPAVHRVARMRRWSGARRWQGRLLRAQIGEPGLDPAAARTRRRDAAHRPDPGRRRGDVKLETNPYGYAGVRPTRLDDRRPHHRLRLLAGAMRAAAGRRRGHTVKPLPGIVAKKGDPVCTTTSVAALRAAAKASEAWTPKRPHRPLDPGWRPLNGDPHSRPPYRPASSPRGRRAAPSGMLKRLVEAKASPPAAD